jgi:hypothetical protein
MSKTKAQPVATKHDEITLILQQAGEDDIEIIHRSGETVIHIKTVSEPQPAEQKGKWARVADKLAAENLLRDGLGDELRAHARRFRETFVLK